MWRAADLLWRAAGRSVRPAASSFRSRSGSRCRRGWAGQQRCRGGDSRPVAAVAARSPARAAPCHRRQPRRGRAVLPRGRHGARSRPGRLVFPLIDQPAAWVDARAAAVRREHERGDGWFDETVTQAHPEALRDRLSEGLGAAPAGAGVDRLVPASEWETISSCRSPAVTRRLPRLTGNMRKPAPSMPPCRAAARRSSVCSHARRRPVAARDLAGAGCRTIVTRTLTVTVCRPRHSRRNSFDRANYIACFVRSVRL